MVVWCQIVPQAAAWSRFLGSSGGHACTRGTRLHTEDTLAHAGPFQPRMEDTLLQPLQLHDQLLFSCNFRRQACRISQNSERLSVVLHSVRLSIRGFLLVCGVVYGAAKARPGKSPLSGLSCLSSVPHHLHSCRS